MEEITPIVVPASASHSATVIMLHGLGDSGAGWESVASQLNLPWVKFVFPTAPTRPVTINGGAQMTAWADIKGLTPDAPEDEASSLQTKSYVHSLIAKEVSAGIPASRVLVGGFSQGAAMACVAALTHPTALAGCFILSGWLALRDKVPSMMTPAGRQTSIFQAHGSQDPMIPLPIGQLTSQVLKMMGIDVDFRQYAMGHSSCPQEITDLRTWMLTRIPAAAAAPPPPPPQDIEVDTSDCLEKADLLRKARSLM